MSVNPETSAGGRIYYPGPGIVVTSFFIKTYEATYRVRDLIVEDPRYSYAYPARTVALFCGIVEMLLALGVAVLHDSGTALLCAAGGVAAIGMAGAVWADNRHNPRWMELTAQHEGRQIVLFASADKRVFEQVRRAVVRAIEANRPLRP